ncbi:MAG: metallophosphoesterase family protein [Eubacteriales bacterium]
MKILVFSDIHGNTVRMTDAIRTHLTHGGVDRVFFLGDGVDDAIKVMKNFPDLPFDYVYGNCDEFFLSYVQRDFIETERLVVAGGLRFLLVHGHKLFVKSQYQFAANYAIDKKADVLLFGHTHQKEDVMVDGDRGGRVRLINPGSCGPCYDPSYAVLNIVNRQLVCGFGEG